MFQIIVNSIIDHIPWWGWVIAIAAPTVALLYFFYPILLPIWRVLPLPVKALLIGIGAGFVAYMGGRYRGRQNAEEEERRRNADALQKRTEVDREIGGLNEGEAEKRLRDRWSSGPS
jgi:hypothetical protein